MGTLKFTMSSKATTKPSDRAIVPVVKNLQTLLNADTAMFLKCYKAGADLEKIQTVITNLDLAITNISKFGLTDQMMAVFNADGALEALCGGSEKLNQLVALEGLGQSIKDALTRIVKWIRSLIAKVVQYFNEVRTKRFDGALKKLTPEQIKKGIESISGKPGYEFVQDGYIVWSNRSEADSCDTPDELLKNARGMLKPLAETILKMADVRKTINKTFGVVGQEDAANETVKNFETCVERITDIVEEQREVLGNIADFPATKLAINPQSLTHYLDGYIKVGQQIAAHANDLVRGTDLWVMLCAKYESGGSELEKKIRSLDARVTSELSHACEVLNTLVMWSVRGTTRINKVAAALIKVK